jgi:hypothetical protein
LYASYYNSRHGQILRNHGILNLQDEDALMSCLATAS